MFRNRLFIIGCVFIILVFVYSKYTDYRDTSLLSDEAIEDVRSINITSGKVR